MDLASIGNTRVYALPFPYKGCPLLAEVLYNVTALARRTAHTDIHNKLMTAYKAVPHSWYLVMLGANFLAAVVMIKTNPLQTEIWALVLAIAIAAFFLVPVGVITAVSNTTIGLNVLTEL
jgi:hypothetical protein